MHITSQIEQADGIVLSVSVQKIIGSHAFIIIFTVKVHLSFQGVKTCFHDR